MKRRKNPRKVAAYLTQYGYWWSCSPEQWRKLLAAAMHGEYDLDNYATPLRGQPSSVRSSVSERSGRRSVWGMVPTFQCLDFDAGDWKYADEEVQQHLGRKL